jgi:hypothetical protein
VGSTLTCTTTYILEVRFLFLGARDSTPETHLGPIYESQWAKRISQPTVQSMFREQRGTHCKG